MADSNVEKFAEIASCLSTLSDSLHTFVICMLQDKNSFRDTVTNPITVREIYKISKIILREYLKVLNQFSRKFSLYESNELFTMIDMCIRRKLEDEARQARRAKRRRQARQARRARRAQRTEAKRALRAQREEAERALIAHLEEDEQDLEVEETEEGDENSPVGESDVGQNLQTEEAEEGGENSSGWEVQQDFQAEEPDENSFVEEAEENSPNGEDEQDLQAEEAEKDDESSPDWEDNDDQPSTSTEL